MAYICGCLPARIKRALADLPETLDETYDRSLREINKADWELAHRLLQFVAVASRPLRVEELAELLAFDFSTETIPKFREGWRLEDPVDAVSACSNLLAIVDHHYQKIVQFSHFSVMEFLISARLVEASDITLRRYHVSIAPAHTLVSRTCVGMLLHLDKDVVTRSSVEKWPLVEYAAENWADHARFEGVPQYVDDGMKQLFDPGKPHLAAWVWIHDPDVKGWELKRRTERPLRPLRTPLHYAALWGLHFIIEYLVTEGHSQKMHVDLRSFPDNATPLHLASKRGHMKAARTLIEHGADVKAKSKDGETPLDSALEESHVDLEVIRMLIGHDTDVTAETKSGSFRLYRAVHNRDVEVARMFIEHGVDVAARIQNDGGTPLHRVSFYGQVELARMLIERGADVKAHNKRKATPLHDASFVGQVEVGCLLIEHGADVMAQDQHGETPLHRASREGKVEFARMLIEHGVDATAQNKNGETPLLLALDSSQYSYKRTTPGSLNSGQVEVAHMLIEHGGNVTTTQNKDGETLLHLASQEGQAEAARMLIERDADVTALNKNRKTPLHLALQKNHAEVARMLIKHSVDVMAQYEDGETLLHLASQLGEVQVARMLIERNADVTAQNMIGETPLHVASSHGQVEVACMLIEHGADVNAQNENGETPLHRASQEGQVEVACVLIERGADVTVRNKIGDTLLHLVSRREDFKTEIARVLIERGADVTARKEDGENLLHLALTPSRRRTRSGSGRCEISTFGVLATSTLPCTSSLSESSEAQNLTPREVEVARMLIDCGVEVAAQNMDGETPLLLALTPSYQLSDGHLTRTVTRGQRGQAEVAHMLIAHGADVTAQNKDGETPLHLALTPSPSYQDPVPYIPLFPSSHSQKLTQRDLGDVTDVEVVRMLIDRGADVTAKNKDRNTPLHLVLTPSSRKWSQIMTRGEVEVVRMLTNHGADLTAQNKDGETPLHLASRQREVAAACMLIDRGADITAQNKHRETPLLLALQENRADVARMLIEHSADVMVQNEDGDNPLHLASRWGQAEIAHMLIERGADVTVQNKHGLAPIHLALTPPRPLHSRGYNDVRIPMEVTRGRLEVARMLIEHGVNVAAHSCEKETPLHLASRYGEVVVARMFIDRGADLTVQNKDRETPLHLALVPVPREDPLIPGMIVWMDKELTVTCGQVDVARMLIEHGTDVRAQNRDGGTPLHLASKWGQVEIVRMLVKRGADVIAQDKDGITPLRLATQGRHREVTDIFLEHGAGTGELPTPESLPITRPAHNPADLPIPSHAAHASLTTSIVADAELPQTTSPFSQPPSDDDVIPERNRHPVVFTRRFLCSLGLVFTAVVLLLSSYWYLSLYEVSRRR